MKAINEKKWSHGFNAWQQATHTACQTFEVQASDVGQTRRDFRGQGHSLYTFRESDVGKQIHVYTDHSSWTCWVFASESVKGERDQEALRKSVGL